MLRHAARIIFATGLLCTTAVVTQAIPAEATASINGKISFAREPDTVGGGALFTMDPDGTDAVQVGTGEGLQWSPDGSLLAFACLSVQPDHVEVCTVAPDGTDLVHVVPKTGGLADPPIDFYPTAWSPDGRRLLIDAGAGLSTNGAGIFTMGPDGSRLSRVTSTATEQF
ncbi:MAG: hypothetical protein M3O29_07660, partial [Actinomycetota bacterium]|nr:hypothetical protein [Actinomycetota bacterium]